MGILIDNKVKDHIRVLCPVLDSQRRFMFFCNRKVAQTSINRVLLKGRSVLYKNGAQRYNDLLKSCLENMDGIFKFTIVRNPWARTVSAFCYLQRIGVIKKMPFREFVLEVLCVLGDGFNPHFRSQYWKTTFRGKLIVDFVAKLENIDKDWNYIAERIGCSSVLPRANCGSHGFYSTFYDRETKEVIGKMYANDVKLFGYVYEEGVR